MNELLKVKEEMEAILALPEFTNDETRTKQQQKVHEAYIEGFRAALAVVERAIESGD